MDTAVDHSHQHRFYDKDKWYSFVVKNPEFDLLVFNSFISFRFLSRMKSTHLHIKPIGQYGVTLTPVVSGTVSTHTRIYRPETERL